jgi:hypothetical protein
MNQEDRELLELAAKAGEIDRGSERTECALSTTEANGRHRYLPRWNPLEDDGDALRLAVKLNMEVRIENGLAVVLVLIKNIGHTFRFEEYSEATPNTAARRAIVRAAAGVGKTMQETSHEQKEN